MRFFEIMEAAAVQVPTRMHRTVLATTRFEKNYSAFTGKYSNVAGTLTDFLEFRNTARPDQSYGPKDSPMTTIPGYRRFHLVLGKAILIYAIVGDEIRLADIVEHNLIEAGRGLATLGKYINALDTEDFHEIIAPVEVLVSALSSAQMTAIRDEMYAMAANASDRPVLVQARDGMLDGLMEYVQLALEGDVTQEALLDSFGGQEALQDVIKNVLMQIKEGRKA